MNLLESVGLGVLLTAVVTVVFLIAWAVDVFPDVDLKDRDRDDEGDMP